MPAPPSSLIDPAIGHLVELAGDVAAGRPGLLEVLAAVADPRRQRGVRYRLAVILGLALCAVAAGARSFTAVAGWAADADEQALSMRGSGAGCPRNQRSAAPCSAWMPMPSMIWGAWAQQAAMPGPEARRVIAGGGKTRRGPASGAGPGQHLLAALGHAYGAVLGQVEVGAKTNEIPMFPMLLDRVDITGAVITADAMHAQRSHATYPAGRGAHYALTVKRNQPGLFTQLAARPGVRSPSPARPASAGTGGLSGAPSKSQRWPPGWPSPMPPRPSRSCAAASCPKKKKWSSETVYAITSLTATQPSPAGLAAIRGHCLIEDRPHWVRDLDYDEDRSQIRTASGPRVMATLRNIAITVLRLAGHASIAAALRYHARRRTGHYGRS